jgi:hypothetical protein
MQPINKCVLPFPTTLILDILRRARVAVIAQRRIKKVVVIVQRRSIKVAMIVQRRSKKMAVIVQRRGKKAVILHRRKISRESSIRYLYYLTVLRLSHCLAFA